MAKIALGVTSSVSIYKACEIVRAFQKKEFEVQVIMTRNATQLISPLLFRSLTGQDVIVELFSEKPQWTIAHVSLSREVSLLLVAPATANIIGKFAAGVADDFLSTLFLTVKCPVLIAPAMNEAMYFHRQTQANIQRLKAMGVKFVEPGRGYLACQEEGWGRLAELEKIVEQAVRLIQQSKSFEGKTVIVTAGATQEPLDPVRYLTNRSSGKMGYELAEEALSRGARVILVSGPTHLHPPLGTEVKRVRTAEEMEREVLASFPQADVVVMAAAVSDFRFASRSEQKIKKEKLAKKVELVTTPDILGKLGQNKRGKVLVGFAAETENIVDNARSKAKAKNLDFIVANDVGVEGIGFESDDNQVVICDGKGVVVETERMSKKEISRIIFDSIEGIIGQKSGKSSR